jgi:hypothetical protein
MANNNTQATLFAMANIFQQLALSLYLPIEDEFSGLETLNEDEITEHDLDTQTDALQVMYLGTLLSVIAATSPSPGPTVRGPYNQYVKCTEFFIKSLGWPEREFRHEYRSVMIFH